jgi:hypothetical protein
MNKEDKFVSSFLSFSFMILSIKSLIGGVRISFFVGSRYKDMILKNQFPKLFKSCLLSFKNELIEKCSKPSELVLLVERIIFLVT